MLTRWPLSMMYGVLTLLVVASAPASADPPVGTFSVQAFQTDRFTGAATADIPIIVPKGAAGTTPELGLSYNSITVDDLKKSDQGQWTGLGWTLNFGGFVLRDTKQTAATTDDTFTLVFGGARHDLVLIDSAQKIYHTKDEMFWKVQYFAAGDYWVLTTKDGKQQRFGFNTNSKAVMLNPDLTTTVTYKYALDQVTTTSGVQIWWTYVKQTGTAPATGRTYDQALYPDTITWAYTSGGAIGSLRKVQFIRGSRNDWTDTSATTQMSFHQTSRLDRIEIYTGAALVRKYVLTYDYSIDRDPATNWGGGASGDLTLKTVTMYGTDGVTAMPALSFTYTPEGRIATASNGIGGTVSFSYEHLVTVPLYRTCLSGNCSDWGTTTGTGGVLLGHILSSAALGETSPLYTQCYNPFGATTGCLDWSVQQTPGVALLGRLVIDDGVLGTVPVYQECQRWNGGNCADLALQTTGTSYRLGYIYSAPIDRFRVSARTVNDGRGNTVTMNTYYRNLAIGTNGEFRGYGVARDVDALGHYTDTWFKQDDVLRGRAYQIEARSSAGTLFTQTVNTFASSNPYPGVTLVLQTATDVVTCDGGQSCRQLSKTFEYDSYGNPTWTHDWGDAAATGDELHLNTVWAVNSANWIHRLSGTVLYDGAWTGVRVTWLSYDGLSNGSLGSRGLLTKEERWLNGAEGAPGNPIVTHTYDSYGNATSETSPLNCTVTTTYDVSQTFPATVSNCLNHTRSAQYDERFGVKTSETDPNSQTTTYTYDVFGRLTKITGPLDSGSTYGTVSYQFNNVGDPNNQTFFTARTTVSGTGNILWTHEHFDGLGRIYLTRTSGPTDQIVKNQWFDTRGQISAEEVPHTWAENGVFTQYTYDAIGRRTQALFPDGTTINTSYAPGLVTATDQVGNVKRSYYDAYNQLVKVEEINGPQTHITTYAYDVAGQLTRVTNAANHVTNITYDMVGRKTATADPNTGNWTYTYDAAGNVLTQTNAKNETVTFTYDPFGRVLTKSYPGGAQVQWTYDDPAILYSKGRVTRISDLTAVTTFRYDELGRNTNMTRILDGTTYVLQQSYDALGRITSAIFPDNDTLSYTYNAGGWLASIPGYVTNITYNSQGLKTQVQYANGVTTNWTYNGNNFRVTNQSTSAPGGPLQNLTYTYDAAGNITQISDSLWTASRTFTYDPLRRLASASGTFGPQIGGVPTSVSQTYQYDGIGNPTNMGGTTYAYSDPMHPSAVTSTSTGFTMTYDTNGNMLTGGGRQATWDEDNRLTATTIQGGNSATFGYDFTGRRVRKQTLAGVTRYPFPGYEVDPSGVITKTLFVSGHRAVAKKSTGQTLFYHNDHLGSVNIVTDSPNANRVQLTEYTPWGMVSRSEGTAETRYSFNGRELDDPEMGLLYYGGRYYSAALARFLSPDPTPPDLANPQTLNRYSYVDNDPVNHVDPSGFKKKKGFWGSVGSFFKKFGGAIAGVVVGAVVTIATMNPVLGAAAGIVVGSTVQGAIDGGLKGAALGLLSGAGLAAGLVLGGVPGAIIGGAATGALAAELGGGSAAMGAASGALSGLIAGIGSVASVQGFGFSFGEGALAVTTAQIANDAVRGFAVGTVTALATGKRFEDALEYGGIMAAFTAASTQFNNLIGHAYGFIASGFKAPQYSQGTFFYDVKVGYIALGNTVSGPRDYLDSYGWWGTSTYRQHELGHVPQAQALGLAYFPVNALALGLSLLSTGNQNKLNPFERWWNPEPLYPGGPAPATAP